MRKAGRGPPDFGRAVFDTDRIPRVAGEKTVPDEPESILDKPPPEPRPFRRAVFRGMAVMLPPLLTVVIILWITGTVNTYVLQPVKNFTRNRWAAQIEKVYETPPAAGKHVQLPNKEYVPQSVHDEVQKRLADDQKMPTTGSGVYRRYVEMKYLHPWRVVVVFIALFILLMYFLGRFLAAGMGRFLYRIFENIIHRVPVIRSVYGSVKQVTDFVLSDNQVEYNRVVAVEYPRKGIWSFGMVTGESMLDIKNAAGEEVLSVLIPTSPAPVTGYTVTVKKSEAIDLNITIEQAFQFIVSCGVVVPPHQLAHLSDAPAAALPAPEKNDRKTPAPAEPASTDDKELPADG